MPRIRLLAGNKRAYRRYAIVAECDLREAGAKLAATLGTPVATTSGDNPVTVRDTRSLNG